MRMRVRRALVAHRCLSNSVAKDTRDCQTVVEVALESLLRQWRELAAWLRDEAQDLKDADILEREAANSIASGMPSRRRKDLAAEFGGQAARRSPRRLLPMHGQLDLSEAGRPSVQMSLRPSVRRRQGVSATAAH